MNSNYVYAVLASSYSNYAGRHCSENWIAGIYANEELANEYAKYMKEKMKPECGNNRVVDFFVEKYYIRTSNGGELNA